MGALVPDLLLWGRVLILLGELVICFFESHFRAVLSIVH